MLIKRMNIIPLGIIISKYPFPTYISDNSNYLFKDNNRILIGWIPTVKELEVIINNGFRIFVSLVNRDEFTDYVNNIPNYCVKFSFLIKDLHVPMLYRYFITHFVIWFHF